MKTKIRLGDKVRDKVTGYTGIAVSRTEFINGCVQYGVARKLKPTENIQMEGDPGIDESVLEVVKERVIDSKEYQREDDNEEDISDGGPTRIVKRMRGY